ncbi:putative ATP-grasp-modified RiPP [Streptomyces griseofuscus]|uniref:putative ATP-grasp-modified RiPP n=1 Tax=Streptomyces griseofuscus TaxID=146922 RepID=UPI0036CF55D5
MSAFALDFAVPRQLEAVTDFTYDPEQQMNVLVGGGLAAENVAVLMSTAVTTSTAGSATHNDDD